MVGSKPTGCNTTILFYKEAGKGANKIFLSSVLVIRLCETRIAIAMVDGFSLPSCTI
jgi:hypothetical protein